MKSLRITFVPLEERHLPLLLIWLEKPHVKAWWDQDIEWTSELVREKFGFYIHGSKVVDGVKKTIHAFIIAIDSKAIGYIQSYNAHDFEMEKEIALDGFPESLAGFDLFIGESEYVGKGYGSRIIRQFLQEHIDSKYSACFVDPNTSNVQAIRAYEKAGFKKITTTKDGTVTFMIKKRTL